MTTSKYTQSLSVEIMEVPPKLSSGPLERAHWLEDSLKYSVVILKYGHGFNPLLMLIGSSIFLVSFEDLCLIS